MKTTTLELVPIQKSQTQFESMYIKKNWVLVILDLPKTIYK